MPKNTFTISEIQDVITMLPQQFEQEPELVTVTNRGKPVLAILPWELYESIVEALGIMGQAELTAAFRQGVRDIAEGRERPWEEVKKELGWK